MTTTSIHWAAPLSAGIMIASVVAALLAFAALRRAAGGPIASARRPGLLAIRAAVLAILAAILLNPVRRQETPGAVERARVFYLLDSSQSMALGDPGRTRWDRALATIQEAEIRRDSRTAPTADAFRFGSRLAAIERPSWIIPEPIPPSSSRGGPGSAVASEPDPPEGPAPAPTDPDTLLTGALDRLAERLGRDAPQAVVLLSDGRARDPDRAEAVARGFGLMNVPISVVPLGDEAVGGDVAIVSLVTPATARKSSQVPAQVFVRSYGYEGRRADLKIVALGPDGRATATLATTPATLQDGLNRYVLAFPAGDQDRRIAARIDPQPREVSADNNSFEAEVAIDHTKIRVLYVEGSTDRYVAQKGGFLGFGGTQEVVGAYSSLQKALMEDPDIECTAVLPSADGDFSVLSRMDERGRGLPETPSELYAYDAIILSNIPREVFADGYLDWIDNWVSRRGGGLCMVGGPNSFGSGGWADTPVARMLPVDLVAGGKDWESPLSSLEPAVAGPLHPIWHIAAEDSENRKLLVSLPKFVGRNRLGAAKPSAEILAREGSGGDGWPALAVQPFGRGRTMAMAVPITRRFAGEFTQSWGGPDARYYKKFWRNAVYWLTENSSIGRRRLLAETDKRLYRPGEPIVLKAKAYDESASATLDYRIAVSIEPTSAAEATADDSPLRRPTAPGVASDGGPLLPWGEEFDLTTRPEDRTYDASLTIAEPQSLPTGVTLTGGVRIEATAYEGNSQVDSTAIEVQILDDPAEGQNPLPDHALLKRIAATSGGTVIEDADALDALLKGLPVATGPPEVRITPAWSRGWLLASLIGLLTIEWFWRRRLGLA